jgi:hypothetical protein
VTQSPCARCFRVNWSEAVITIARGLVCLSCVKECHHGVRCVACWYGAVHQSPVIDPDLPR